MSIADQLELARRIPDQLPTPGSIPVVRAESLTKRFGDVVAVDDLSFELEDGTITGFLGPNGAG
jgi:ABC-type sugar transport system ATPase subunit